MSKIIGKLNPKSNQRLIVYDKEYNSPTLQCAMGTGGGQVPLIIENNTVKEYNTIGKPKVIGKAIDFYNKRMRKDNLIGTITTNSALGNIGVTAIIEQKGILTNGKEIEVASTILAGYHKSNMTGFNSDNGVIEKVKIKQATKKGFIECRLGGVADLSYPDSKTRRGRVQNEGNISPTLTAQGVDGLHKIESIYRIRKLTPLECWRLMGFNDDEFKRAEKVNSNTQLYKQAGNSIVVDVLYYLFKEIFEPKEKQLKGQISLDDLRLT